MRCNELFIIILLLLLFIDVKAQYTEKIETDRPDQTESPYVIAKKHFQGELGFNIEKFTNDVFHFVHPTALLKYGVFDRMELRLQVEFYKEHLPLIPNLVEYEVLEPVEMGTKIRILEENGLMPKTSFIGHIGLPFLASKRFHSDPVNYSMRLSMQNSLSEAVSLGYNLGIEGGGNDETTFIYTLAPGFNIGEKWYAYAEVYGYINNDPPQHNIDGGLAYYATNDIKIDLSGGFGVGSSDLKYYLAAGFSWRLPFSKKK